MLRLEVAEFPGVFSQVFLIKNANLFFFRNSHSSLSLAFPLFILQRKLLVGKLERSTPPHALFSFYVEIQVKPFLLHTAVAL
jgi:hypothetical protein